MNNFLRNTKRSALLLLILLMSVPAFSEGTKQLSPASNKITALTLIPNRFSGSYLNAPEANRFRFYINSVDEYVFCGFRWKEYVSAGNNADDINMFYKLYNANGVLVGSGQLPTSGAGYIQNYTQAVNGPNGVDGITTTGYVPISFRIGDMGANYSAGEYSMEFYRSSDNGATQRPGNYWSTAPYWDFTIAKKVGNNFTSIPGRIFCRKWGFVAVNSSLQVTPSANSAPSLYSYSDDQTVIKIGFNDVFRPIAYDLAVNFYGVTKTGANGNFDVDRLSINSVNSPDIPDGYRLFLNTPDDDVYPIKPITVQPVLANPAVSGCGTNLTINFNMPAPGDARILIDLNGTDGYDAGTADRILEVFNVPAGPGSVAWDGKNGLGVQVANAANMKITATYERGRFNFPLYDAEINKNGFNVASIAPLASTTTPLYWDDSTLLVNVNGSSDDNQDNVTGKGINNKFKGQPSPAHAWNGNGNPTMIVPAPSISYSAGNNEANGVQWDDFGNVRVINTWGWALQQQSSVANVKFGCYPVNGNVYHDANGLTDNLVNSTSALAIPTNLYANIVSKDVYTDNDGVTRTTLTVQGVALVNANGTYSITNVPNGVYYIVLSTTQGSVGSHTIPGAALPTSALGNWINTGENLAAPTVVGNDGLVNGQLAVTVNNAAVNNANFAIQQLPVSTNVTATPQGNPGGTNKVTVPTLPGKDPEDGTYTGGNTVIINTIPLTTKGILYYNNTPVTAGQIIPSYDPTKLTVDPVDGNVTVTFTYTHVDASGKPSTTPATATLEFKVIPVSGNIWDDGNGNLAKDGTEAFVSGNNTNTGTTVVAGGADLYVYLLNSSNVVIQKTQVDASGNYSFANAPYDMSGLKLQLSTTVVAVDNAMPASTLGTNWTYIGENVNASNTASQTGSALGFINLTTGTSAAVVNQNFAIERLPSSDDKSLLNQSNPGGNNQVVVPTLTGNDGEDLTYGSGAKIIIKSLPTVATGVLYYNGTPVTLNQQIDSYDPTLLKMDPANGNVTPVFTYVHVDAAGKEDPTVATVTLGFKVIEVSGNVWNDADGSISKNGAEKFVSGDNTASGTTVAAGVLYANLIDANGKVIQSVQVAANGTYSLTNTPPNATGLKIQLSKNNSAEAAAIPTTALPLAGWLYTGEVVAGNTASQTGAPEGVINLTTLAASIGNQNFGIEKTPTSDPKTVGVQGNPGGTNKVTVPVLTGSDFEDVSYTGTSLTNKIIINTLPTTAMGILYYNNIPVTAGQTISSYDPSKLTIDPADGTVTVTFTYSHLDAATQPSTPVVVKMDFAVITVSGNVWQDKNTNKINDNGEKFISGTNVASGAVSIASGANLYVNLLNASDVVIQTVQVSATGTYTLDKVPQSTNGLKIQLSTTQGAVDATKPTTTLPPLYVVTGQSIGAGNSATQTGILNTINLNTAAATITAQNFGLKEGGYCFVGRVYLEGALMNNGGATASDGRPLMRDNLRSSPGSGGRNYIPANDPYSIAAPTVDVTSRYTKLAPQSTNAEYRRVTDSAAVFSVTGQNAIVDWVFVELRDKNTPATVLATRSGLLQRDGDIVDVDGVSCLFFKDVPSDNYYVAIRHRSHLGVMTKTAQTPSQMQTMVDLTLASTPVYDKGPNNPGGFDYTGLATKNTVITGYRALWAGDFDANHRVKYDAPNDDQEVLLNNVLNYPTNTGLFTNFNLAYGYFQGDFDMSSKAKYDAPNDDQEMLINQVLNYRNNPGLFTNFNFVLEQLP